MSDDELRALAAQLACPHGEQALAVGERMNEINVAIVAESTAALAPGAGETVVEIGPGNGVLSAALVTALGPHGRYIGLERSPAMAAEASAFLSGCAAAAVEVQVTDCLAASLPAGSVDAVIAINLLYFIDEPAALFSRIRGWLRPGGRAVFGVRSEGSMRAIPCTRFGFHLHSPEALVAALLASGFAAVDTGRFDDKTDSSGGALGEFFVIRADV